MLEIRTEIWDTIDRSEPYVSSRLLSPGFVPARWFTIKPLNSVPLYSLMAVMAWLMVEVRYSMSPFRPSPDRLRQKDPNHDPRSMQELVLMLTFLPLSIKLINLSLTSSSFKVVGIELVTLDAIGNVFVDVLF